MSYNTARIWWRDAPHSPELALRYAYGVTQRHRGKTRGRELRRCLIHCPYCAWLPVSASTE